MPNLAIVRTRLEMASRLVLSCGDLLADWRPAHRGQEIRRRDLESAARVVLMCVVDLCRGLAALRLRLGPDDCPHCAWPVAPRSVERCPRCNGSREVADEARLRHLRDAS